MKYKNEKSCNSVLFKNLCSRKTKKNITKWDFNRLLAATSYLSFGVKSTKD